MVKITGLDALGRGGGGAVEVRRDETAATVSPSERSVIIASFNMIFDINSFAAIKTRSADAAQ